MFELKFRWFEPTADVEFMGVIDKGGNKPVVSNPAAGKLPYTPIDEPKEYDLTHFLVKKWYLSIKLKP